LGIPSTGLQKSAILPIFALMLRQANPRFLAPLLGLLVTSAMLAQNGPPKDSALPAAASEPGAALRDSLAKQRAAMEVQREATRKQAELLRLEPLEHHLMAAPVVEFDCEPISEATVTPLIEGAAKTNNLETDLLRAVIRQESQFYPCAVSDRGAEGLMQLMPSTIQQFGVSDAFDPKQSIEAGAKYLKQLFEKYKGKLDLVLGAYNAGPGMVDEAKGVPDIPETRSYVQAILDNLGVKPLDTKPLDTKPLDTKP
jgi:Transglycosylase SLT domain